MSADRLEENTPKEKRFALLGLLLAVCRKWLTPRSTDPEESFREASIRLAYPIIVCGRFVLIWYRHILEARPLPEPLSVELLLSLWAILALLSLVALLRRRIDLSGLCLVLITAHANLLGVLVVGYQDPFLRTSLMVDVTIAAVLLPTWYILPYTFFLSAAFGFLTYISVSSRYQVPPLSGPAPRPVIAVASVSVLLLVEVAVIGFLRVEIEKRLSTLQELVAALKERISERERAEKELRRRAEELTALQATVLDITAPHDLPNLLQTIVERAVRLLGTPSGGMYLCDPDRREVRCVVSYNTPEDYAGTVLKYGKGAAGTVAETGEPLIIDDYRSWSGRASVYEEEQPFTSVLSAPMIWQGQVTGVIHVLHSKERRHFIQADLELLTLFANHAAVAIENARLYEQAQEEIEERKQAEEEREQLTAQIREEARRVQQIIITVPEGVLLLDAEGRIVLTNPAAEKGLAILVNHDVISAHEPVTHLGDRPLAEILTSPPTRGLWHEVKASGRTFEVIARPMENGTEPEDWVLIINDVTQEREVRERLQRQGRLAAVGQLAAGIAHDFNNIMATIVLYAQMSVRVKELSPRIRERLDTINQQAQHATRLIQQILDFSRQAVLTRQPLDLLPLLKEGIKLLERTLPEHIEIDLAYNPDEYTVMADPTRIQQMVTNLALNARDAMPQGGALRIGLERVEVKLGTPPLLPEMETGSWIQLTVSDTGTGIPPDVLPHIFEPFFTTKEPGLGTGLGLAQVYGIVGQHEGRIDVETQVGKGTTFTIYLPVLLDAPTVSSVPELSAMPQGDRQTVLVVEDEVSVRKALVESLETLNYQVLEAASGQDALEILDQHEVALVLSDVVMPRMGGIALFHAMKQKGLMMPMVLLTGHPMEKALEDLQTEGLSAWLPKPPELERLAEVVAWALMVD